mgnify:CR=1 FL=1
MIQIIPDADFSGNGLASVASPLPSHGGKLFATYLPGSGWNGPSNAGQDYSGQRGDLYLGSAAVSALGVGAVAADYAQTPFTAAECAAGNGAMTWCGVVKVPTGSTVIPLFNAGVANPYAALHLSPNSNSIAGFKVDGGGATSVSYVYNADVLGEWAFVHGRWNATTIKAGLVRPASGWLGSAGYATLASSKTFLNALPIRVLPVDGSSSGDPVLAIGGFYSADLSDAELAEVYYSAKTAMAMKGVQI